jgi:hypothetical protein
MLSRAVRLLGAIHAIKIAEKITQFGHISFAKGDAVP